MADAAFSRLPSSDGDFSTGLLGPVDGLDRAERMANQMREQAEQREMQERRLHEQQNAFFQTNGRPESEILKIPGTRSDRAPKMSPVYRSTYADLKPGHQGEVYFPRLAQDEQRRTTSDFSSTIGICIPCYNEEANGLINTLGSLVHLEIPQGFKLNIIILMDGVKPGVPHDTTRQLLTKMYGVDWEQFGDPATGEDWPDRPNLCQTTVYESLQWYKADETRAENNVRGSNSKQGLHKLWDGIFGSETGVGDRHGKTGNRFRVSCLIKKKNLRKHNSHEWFMSAFGEELDCKYIFCTDCSTVFDNQMLVKLTAYLEQHSDTSAVCGRQRVMSAFLQNKGTDKPRTGEWSAAPFEYFLRQVQTYDFEADHPVSKASFDFLGWLPVLPGPCGMYRFCDLRAKSAAGPKSRRDKYFELVNKSSEECGLVLANLKIAEDRIPSLNAVFHETDAFKTHWVHDAVFYFEAETTLKALVLQRRRWLNGTNAGYLHIMLNVKKYIWSSSHSFTMKLFTTAMLTMQLLQIAVLSLGPSIFASILFAILHYVCAPACPISDYHQRVGRLLQRCPMGTPDNSFSENTSYPMDTRLPPDGCPMKCATAMLSYLQCGSAVQFKKSLLAEGFGRAADLVTQLKDLEHDNAHQAELFANVSGSALHTKCLEQFDTANRDAPNPVNAIFPDPRDPHPTTPLGQYSLTMTTSMQVSIAAVGMGLYLLFYLIFLCVHRVKFRKRVPGDGPVRYKKSTTPSGPGWEKEPGSEYKSWAWKVAIVINAMVVISFAVTIITQIPVFTALLGKYFDKSKQIAGDYTAVPATNCYNPENTFFGLKPDSTLNGTRYGTAETVFDQPLWEGMEPVVSGTSTAAISFCKGKDTVCQLRQMFTKLDPKLDDIKDNQKNNKYVLRLTTTVNWHSTGVYHFTLKSDRASTLYYLPHGGTARIVVDNDGGHGRIKIAGLPIVMTEKLGQIEVSEADVKNEHQLAIVYWTEDGTGKKGATLEAKWKKPQLPPDPGHAPPPEAKFEVMGSSEKLEKPWKVEAYKSSCYHWISSSGDEAKDNPATTDIVEREDMWIESEFKDTCKRHGKKTQCADESSLYYFPRSALRCGKPNAEKYNPKRDEQMYWQSANEDAESKCGVECMPGHLQCPDECGSEGASADCAVCVNLTPSVINPDSTPPGLRKYDAPSVEKCEKDDDDPAASIVIWLVLNVYVLVPLLFSFIDAPFSGSLKSPALLIRSAVVYILFMPTFVAWFAAYSTNRLSDVSWGQRAVESGISPGELKIVNNAVKVNALVVLCNLAFAAGTAYLRAQPDPRSQVLMLYISYSIMGVAGYGFGVSFVSYIARAFDMLICSQKVLGDDSGNTGLGYADERASFARSSFSVRNTAANIRMQDFDDMEESPHSAGFPDDVGVRPSEPAPEMLYTKPAPERGGYKGKRAQGTI